MRKVSSEEARDVISNWGTAKVVALLQKNGVEEACWKAVEKRKINGDELLHLTEGKLTLWKSDLTRPLIWSLSVFVEKLKKCPENYVEDEYSHHQSQENDDAHEQRESPIQQQITISTTTTQQVEAASAEISSDASSWDTDFDDSSVQEDSGSVTEGSVDMRRFSSNSDNLNPDFRSSLRLFQENDRLKKEADAARGSSYSLNSLSSRNNNNNSNSSNNNDTLHQATLATVVAATTTQHQATSESTYANCEAAASSATLAESTYANVDCNEQPVINPNGCESTSAATLRNPSRLYSISSDNDNGNNNNNNNNNNHETQQSLKDKLVEQLKLLGVNNGTNNGSSKPTVAPKPEALAKRSKDDVAFRRNEPRTSFLHKTAMGKSNGAPTAAGELKRPTAQPPSEKTAQQSLQSHEETLKNLPKPPVSIRGFDLVANLPHARQMDESDESDDDDDGDDEEEGYEPFDDCIIEQHEQQQRDSMIRADSGQSLASARLSSSESVYHPSSSVSHDEEVYEIYESITESPEENGHDFKNESSSKNIVNPPPLPSKPPPNITNLHNQYNKMDSKSERSLEKKAATLPHSGSNTSLTNAARPLPPPPEKEKLSSYYERPWFHNLSREQANLLIQEQCTYHNAPDGCFLLRPSSTNPDNPYTLVLWCKDRVYNVPVRRRADNRYALGKSKLEERSFASVDEIIPFYKQEKLILYTGGVQSGSTKLTDTPPKQQL